MLDANGRVARARKASQVAANKRAKKAAPRIRLIRLAYARLTSSALSKDEELEAIAFLQTCGRGVSLPAQTSPYSFLADVAGLTRQRVWAIINEAI
jgi:hypothetical protein